MTQTEGDVNVAAKTRKRLRPKTVSMDHWMVVENLRHRLRTTSGIERETHKAMSWAEAEMMLQLADAFRRTQPVWFEHFNRTTLPRVALQPSETALGSPSIPSPANGAK